MILYIENPKYATRKLLELKNKVGKVAGYKINTQKSHAFLYTNNEKSEQKIKESIPLTTATKTIKYLGIVGQTVKHLPTMQEARVRLLGREFPLEKEMATHSSVLAWRIPGTGEPGGLPSMGLYRVGHD